MIVKYRIEFELSESRKLNRSMWGLIREGGEFFIVLHAGIEQCTRRTQNKSRGKSKFRYSYHTNGIYNRIKISIEYAKELFNEAFDKGIIELPVNLDGNVTIPFCWPIG